LISRKRKNRSYKNKDQKTRTNSNEGRGIAVDSSGNAYVTGRTEFSGFPTTSPIQAENGGCCSHRDAFVTKINAAGSAHAYSTYLGGSDNDQGDAIAVDRRGNAYVTGRTDSTDFPTTNPIQEAKASSSDDAFVTKINAAGSAHVYSTYFGGADDDDRGEGIAVDSRGNAYVTGRTGSDDFPTTNPIQAENGGCCSHRDAFVLKISSSGGGSDASEYLTKPTFGLDHKTGVVQVEGGFIANGKIFDVTDNWWTDFEKQAILVGQTNTFSAKAFAPHVINIIEFMFGIPEVGFAQMAEATIEVTIDRDQNVINVRVIQNGNLIDPATVTATATMVSCKSGDTDKKCYFITVSGVFNEALMNDVFALKGIDFLRHFHITYLNEGFTIFGNSLNPATTLLIASNVKGSSGLMEVTQIDKINDMWVDETGVEYERNSFDSFIRTTPIEVVRDDPMVKVMTRMNSNFETMKQNELDKATAIFDSSLIQKELPDSYRIESGDRYDKLQDPEVQLKLFIERMRADDKMNQLMQMWYAKPNPNQLN